MNKEQIYDEKISPLMQQIIEICKESGIALVANFHLPSEEDPGLGCMTILSDGAGEMPEHHSHAAAAIRPKRASPMLMTTHHGDGSQTLAAII